MKYDKPKVVIWGAGVSAVKIYYKIKDEMDVLFFVDIDPKKQKDKIDNCKIENPNILKNRNDIDKIILGTLTGNDVIDEIIEMGIPAWKLDTSEVDLIVKPRLIFLQNFSDMVKEQKLYGCVAEAGVFRGGFAREINKYFPESKCFLFDTFEGFNSKDFKYERIKTDSMTCNCWYTTSQELVYNRMPHKENVKIFKGYFPETVTEEVLSEKYIFVNLDMDLYKPTLDGLRIFWPRMIDGGVILVHDYYNENFPNIKQAIFDFENEQGIKCHKIPIGDGLSVAIIK